MQNMDEIFNDAALQKRERVKVEVPDVFNDYWDKTIIITNKLGLFGAEHSLRRLLMMFPEVEDCSKGTSFNEVYYDLPSKILSNVLEFLDAEILKTVISFNSHFNHDFTVCKLIQNIAYIFAFNSTIIFIDHKKNKRETLYPVPLMRIVSMEKYSLNDVDIEYRNKLQKITDVLK
jgi:hypothetical protein